MFYGICIRNLFQVDLESLLGLSCLIRERLLQSRLSTMRESVPLGLWPKVMFPSISAIRASRRVSDPTLRSPALSSAPAFPASLPLAAACSRGGDGDGKLSPDQA